MSRSKIRKALETAVAALGWTDQTAWENVPFEPTVSVAYQRVWILWAEPANDEYSRAYREQGVLQISLCYPLGKGPGEADTRAIAIRNAFPRGQALTADGLVTTITRTPEIASGTIADDRYVVTIRIRFHANIAS